MKRKTFKIIFCITILLSLLVISTRVFADVGSFERYDSGSGSSWSSSSSWDSDYSSGSGGIMFLGGGSWWMYLIFIGIAIFSVYSKNKNRNIRPPMNYVPNPQVNTNGDAGIEGRIKEIDPLFSEEKFLSWSKNLFITLQNAWTKRDWEAIRPFESDQLFEQHSKQLQEYINNKKINVMERIAVNYANLAKFEVEGDKELLSINLKATMKDYIVDEVTNKVLEGDATTDRITVYRLTFMRKAGVKTKESNSVLSSNNCPNCGAPLKITMGGKCEYCSGVITNGEHDWVLVNLDVIQKIR